MHTRTLDEAAARAAGVNAATGDVAKLQLKIGGMACSFCTNSITKALERQSGVRAVSVNLAHEEALIEYEPSRTRPAALAAILHDIGFTVRPADRDAALHEQEAFIREQRGNLILVGVFVVIAAAAMLLMWFERLTPAGMAALHWLMPFLALSLRCSAPAGTSSRWHGRACAAAS